MHLHFPVIALDLATFQVKNGIPSGILALVDECRSTDEEVPNAMVFCQT